MRHGHENEDVVMVCDAPNLGERLGPCDRQVRRAPRIIVPSCTPWEPGHAALRVMTTLHYCELHQHAFDRELRTYWTAAQKTIAEGIARQTRPADFRPDFERARVELVLVTTPEYRAFLAAAGFKRVVA